MPDEETMNIVLFDLAERVARGEITREQAIKAAKDIEDGKADADDDASE